MLEQPRPKRQRATSQVGNAPTYLLIKKAPVTLPTTPGATKVTKMTYHRPVSPGSRRLQNPARVSDSFADSYSSYNPTSARLNSYPNPRASAGVVPISTQTFVTVGGGQPASAPYRSEQRYDSYTGKPLVDSYSGRPRRSSLVDTNRGSSTVTNIGSRGTRPTVVQNNDYARPSSPVKNTTRTEYYVTPAATTPKEQPRTKVEHKKLYAVDDGGAKLVADVDMSAGADTSRHQRRRESVERIGQNRSIGGGYGGVSADRERGRERRSYHANGPKARDKDIDDEDAYSYTDAAGMYRDTEPRWRETRPRRGSMDRGGASRERPASMMVEVGALGAGLGAYADPRSSVKDVSGPPPSTRGWDKIPDLGRSRSTRVAQSPTRTGFLDPRDPYYVPPRAVSRDGRPRANSRDSRPLALHQDRPVERSGYDDYDHSRDSRRERRPSVNRRNDQSIERRGFGIRSSSRDGYGRASEENFAAPKTYPRDSAYAEPLRRDPAPELSHQDYSRLEQERKDRDRTQQTDRGYDSSYERERPREHERARERDHKYDDRPTDRERERQRMMEREPDREHRHHHRRETADKEKDYRKENGDGPSSGVAKVATGGLAGAAAAFGLNKIFGNNDKDKDRDRDSDKENKERERGRERDRERTRDKERERERDRERERERERNRDRERDRYDEPPRAADRDLERRARDQMSYSDDSAPQDRPHRDPHADQDQGLGFAFEKQLPLKSGQSSQSERKEHEKERFSDREFDDGFEKPGNVEMHKPAVDPDEDYRRRMEQVQRELGRSSQDERDGNGSGSDADRERRRREREARTRDREVREPKLDAGVGLASFNTTAPPPQLKREFDEVSQSTAPSATGDLKRKPSILDGPMSAEPTAQIIDNSFSDKRENRVRIVDPPTEEEEKRPKGILKKPTDKFPEDPNAVREGVAPLKDVRIKNIKNASSGGEKKGGTDEEQATKKGIPPGARWTKIDRRLVNPEALVEANERFEERLDCVIVLRVLTKEEIQKLADRTRKIRDDRYEEERTERKALRRRERNKDRRERDEYSDDSGDEYAERAPKMLEAPATPGASASTYDAGGNADFVREAKDRREQREGERERQYMSGGLGRRPEEQIYAQQHYPGQPQGYMPPPAPQY